jgi:hypothetical protein
MFGGNIVMTTPMLFANGFSAILKSIFWSYLLLVW